MSRIEIKISGFGGQGVILTGYVIGKAASIFDDKHATMMQSFGPEARGGAASAQVVVSEDRVLYPYVTRPKVLITLSQEAYDRFAPELGDDGVLLYEEDLVKPKKTQKGIKNYGIPATRLAERLGRKIVLNMVMLGFFNALTDVVTTEAMKKGIRASVPKGTEELNIRAFDAGFNFGRELSEKGG
jgi:2-oxoglutarate ferredoxin oxidoreductase subunit gamma